MIPVNIIRIGKWDKSTFYIYVDDKRIYEQSFAYKESEKLCAPTDQKEIRENVDILLTHTSSSATVVLTSNLADETSPV
jgi:hypothetical protein